MPKKRQPQRPAAEANAEQENRTKGVRVMVTESEFQAIKERAWQARETVSNWARNILLKHLKQAS